jgi:hypothetical protein
MLSTRDPQSIGKGFQVFQITNTKKCMLLRHHLLGRPKQFLSQTVAIKFRQKAQTTNPTNRPLRSSKEHGSPMKTDMSNNLFVFLQQKPITGNVPWFFELVAKFPRGNLAQARAEKLLNRCMIAGLCGHNL